MFHRRWRPACRRVHSPLGLGSTHTEGASVINPTDPADPLALRAAAPDWFRWAISSPKQSRVVTVEDCPIHYLFWPAQPETSIDRGLLFVHGGGAHAQWWSFIAPYFTRDFRVAAVDLSGMGDSGRRASYRSGFG